MTAAPPSIACEDLMIPSDTPGIQLFIRNKRRADLSAFSAERTVLFVHGLCCSACWPSPSGWRA